DPDAAYTLMNDMLQNYSVPRGTERKYALLRRMPDSDIPKAVEGTIEDVFADLRNLSAGDRGGAYEIMRNYEQILFQHLVETTDVPKAYIKEVTQFIDDVGTMHIYNAEFVGQTALGGAVGDMARLGGENIHTPGRNLTSEMWNGAMHIPDKHQVKRITAYQSQMGEIANFITSRRVMFDKDLQKVTVNRKEWKAMGEADRARLEKKLAKIQEKAQKAQQKVDKELSLDEIIKDMKSNTQRVEIQDRAGYYLARSAMNKIWKPLVLLRGAWTLRIMIDDQMRIGA
ncbi:unnamed protein product, partial [marine sediment metagenome]